MDSEPNQALLQPKEEKMQCIKQQSKSLELLKSASTIFTNTHINYILLMLFSLLPLFAFMVFSEVKLQTTVSKFPVRALFSHNIFHPILISYYHDISEDNTKRWDLSQLALFYLLIYPLLSLFNMTITVNLAAQIHAGEKQATLKQLLNHCLKINIKGPFITCLYVHLLSSLTLLGIFLGIFWVCSNHLVTFLGSLFMVVLSVLLSVVVICKYLDWSAFWNLAMVISILEGEYGIGAFGLAAYYGKRYCKRSGFELMVGFFVYGLLLRLPCLCLGSCNGSFGGVLVTTIVIGLVCLGHLVKWVVFVGYFYDCKQHVMEKKVDEGVAKAKGVTAGDLC